VGIKLVIAFFFSILASTAQAEECASHYSELNKTERLSQLKGLFQGRPHSGLVNKTKGSYLVLQNHEDELTIVFYTSGLFNLYGIRKEGELKVCDTGIALHMVALDRDEDLKIEGLNLTIGDGGDKMSFAVGDMPEDLRRLHGVDIRGIAAEQP
jgi:hypothetical protein